MAGSAAGRLPSRAPSEERYDYHLQFIAVTTYRCSDRGRINSPRILNFVVAIYLIFIGVTGLWPHLLSAFPH
jgi:hypothetical protein